jgi:hypothetical protein
MMKKLHERCAGLSATSAVLIVGLISLSSLVIEIGVTSLPDDGSPKLIQDHQASPVATWVNPAHQRGLILYFLMQATQH